MNRSESMPDPDGWDDRLDALLDDALRALPRPACPPRVTRAVFRRTRAFALRDAARDLGRRAAGAGRSLWQPALAMSVLLAVVLSAALLSRPPEPAPTAEVDRALAEVKWTLAYLSQVGRQTGGSVQDALAPLRDEASSADAPNAAPRNDNR